MRLVLVERNHDALDTRVHEAAIHGRLVFVLEDRIRIQRARRGHVVLHSRRLFIDEYLQVGDRLKKAAAAQTLTSLFHTFAPAHTKPSASM